MYAIIESGGKQYNIKNNKNIYVEKINKPLGKIIKLKIILIFKKNMIILGKKLKKYLILAKIIKHFKNKKIKILKFKRRKNYKKMYGHRQKLTQLLINTIKKI